MKRICRTAPSCLPMDGTMSGDGGGRAAYGARAESRAVACTADKPGSDTESREIDTTRIIRDQEKNVPCLCTLVDCPLPGCFDDSSGQRFLNG